MPLAIIGDLSLAQVVDFPSFRNQFSSTFTFLNVSSLTMFGQYKSLMPSDTRYLVVGSLRVILADLDILGLQFRHDMKCILDVEKAVKKQPL
jgi:hypothetical protein